VGQTRILQAGSNPIQQATLPRRAAPVDDKDPAAAALLTKLSGLFLCILPEHDLSGGTVCEFIHIDYLLSTIILHNSLNLKWIFPSIYAIIYN
jgi:hypothetical protein